MNTTALSIQQPWAAVIVAGLKDIENRTWPTSFRGRFLVHATKWSSERAFHEDLEYIKTRLTRDAMADLLSAPLFDEVSPVRRYGAIIGEATLSDCVNTHSSRWFEGRYGWVLRDAKRLKPIEAKGRLGFWSFDSSVPA